VFCSKDILTKGYFEVGYEQPTCLCIKMELFHENRIHFRGAVFIHVGQAQLCTEMVFCFTCIVLWKLHG